MQATHPHTDFIQITGSDSVANLITEWTDYRELLERVAVFAIHLRPGLNEAIIGELSAQLLARGEPLRYIPFTTANGSISATDIRKAIRADKQSIAVPSSVLKYIHHAGLYKG